MYGISNLLCFLSILIIIFVFIINKDKKMLKKWILLFGISLLFSFVVKTIEPKGGMIDYKPDISLYIIMYMSMSLNIITFVYPIIKLLKNRKSDKNSKGEI